MKLSTALTISLLGLSLVAVMVGVRITGARSTETSSVLESSEGGNEPKGATTGAMSPILVELFTSEGCSSCPPADQVLSNLEKEQSVPGADIIVLSQHVDYWNQLGWRDPYSSAEFSARQSNYAGVFGRNGVYTPQMIVDGRLEFVGSNSTKALEAITQATRFPKAKIRIDLVHNLDKRQDRSLQFAVQIENIPAISKGDTAEVLLAITESDLSSSVATGENAGRNLRHTAVVRRLDSVAIIGGLSNERSFTTTAATIPNTWRREKLRAVVFVQERLSRHVLGSAMIEIAK